MSVLLFYDEVSDTFFIYFLFYIGVMVTMKHLQNIRASLQTIDLEAEDVLLQEALVDAPMDEIEEAELIEQQAGMVVALESDEAAITEVTKAMDIVANASTLVQESLEKRGLVRPDTLQIIDAAVQAVAPSTPTEVSMESFDLEAEGDPAPTTEPPAQPAATEQKDTETVKTGLKEKAKALLDKLIEWFKNITKKIGDFFNKERILMKNLKGNLAKLIEKVRTSTAIEITVGGMVQIGTEVVDVKTTGKTIADTLTGAVNTLTTMVNGLSGSGLDVDWASKLKEIGKEQTAGITSGRAIRYVSNDGKYFVIDQVVKDFKASEEKVKMDRNTAINALRGILSMCQLADKLYADETRLKAECDKVINSFKQTSVTEVNSAGEAKSVSTANIDTIKALRNAPPRLMATLRIEATTIYKAFAGGTFTGGTKPAETPAQPAPTGNAPAATA